MRSEQDSYAKFRTTRWSVVAMAGSDDPEAQKALEELCHEYWFPLYAFARRSGHSFAEAKDLVQGFFVQVIEKSLFARANEGKGKLRTFLLTTFRRHMAHEGRKQDAQKRGGVHPLLSIDEMDAESWYHEQMIDGESPEHMYDRQWALTLLDKAVKELGRQWSMKKKETTFKALRPFLTQSPEGPAYDEAQQILGISRANLKTTVHRLRAEFRECLREQVRGTQLSDSEWQDELQTLLQAIHPS